MEESESKQWSVAEGVSGRGERKGERGLQGGSVSQGLDAGRRWEGAEMCVFVGVRRANMLAGGAHRSQDSSTPVLACGLRVCVCFGDSLLHQFFSLLPLLFVSCILTSWKINQHSFRVLSSKDKLKNNFSQL